MLRCSCSKGERVDAGGESARRRRSGAPSLSSCCAGPRRCVRGDGPSSQAWTVRRSKQWRWAHGGRSPDAVVEMRMRGKEGRRGGHMHRDGFVATARRWICLGWRHQARRKSSGICARAQTNIPQLRMDTAAHARTQDCACIAAAALCRSAPIRYLSSPHANCCALSDTACIGALRGHRVSRGERVGGGVSMTALQQLLTSMSHPLPRACAVRTSSTFISRTDARESFLPSSSLLHQQRRQVRTAATSHGASHQTGVARVWIVQCRD